jgi:hypothetical protein
MTRGANSHRAFSLFFCYVFLSKLSNVGIHLLQVTPMRNGYIVSGKMAMGTAPRHGLS